MPKIIQSRAAQYEYALKDHLGNSRVWFSDMNDDGVVDVNHTAATSDELIQEDDRPIPDLQVGMDVVNRHTRERTVSTGGEHPFGLRMNGGWEVQTGAENAYQFNGIEKVGDFGLGWEVAHFRTYDATLGRWGQVDPKAESFISMSGYNGMLNSPIMTVDPMGDEGTGWQETENGHKTDDPEAIASFMFYMNASSSRNGSFFNHNVAVFATDRDPSDSGTNSAYQSAKMASSLTGLTVLEVKDACDLAGQLAATLSSFRQIDPDATIGTLIIDSHGTYPTASFKVGSEMFSADKLSKIKNSEGLAAVKESLSSESNILLTACHAGTRENKGINMLAALSGKMLCDIYACQSWTQGGALFKYINPSFQWDTECSKRPRACKYEGKWTRMKSDGTFETGVIRLTPGGSVIWWPDREGKEERNVRYPTEPKW